MRIQNQSDSLYTKDKSLWRFGAYEEHFKIPEAQGGISCHISKVKNNFILGKKALKRQNVPTA